mmetsp:Transcript_51113/g.147470  ORF Transcript_51113/g.147470 Transcript_51113/m.147470 type:complete len:455 (-) Transcript_51113:6-1370(-)
MGFVKPAGMVASAVAGASEQASVVKLGNPVKEERVYAIAAQAVAVRKQPDAGGPRTGEILRSGTTVTVVEALTGDDGRVYLRLAQDRGWLFDDAALYPEDPAVKLLRVGGISIAEEIDKAPAQRETPVARIHGSVEEHLPGCTTRACREHTFYLIQVIRGSKESVVDVAATEYEARLDRKDETRLGLRIEVHQNAGCLVVKEVIGGLAAQWNEDHPDVEIRPGDRIVEVNGIDGTPHDVHRLNEECKKRGVVALRMRRGTERPVMPGLRVTVRRAFGQLREGQKGDVVKVDDDGDSLIKFVGHGQQWVGRENYGCLGFEDIEGFYLKRYEDFKVLYQDLKRRVASGKCPMLASQPMPDFPEEETLGFRRFLSVMAMSTFMEEREAGLQRFLDGVLSRVPTLDSDPMLLQFFGADPVPRCGSALLQDFLRLRLDALVERIQRHRAERKQQARLQN